MITKPYIPVGYKGPTGWTSLLQRHLEADQCCSSSELKSKAYWLYKDKPWDNKAVFALYQTAEGRTNNLAPIRTIPLPLCVYMRRSACTGSRLCSPQSFTYLLGLHCHLYWYWKKDTVESKRLRPLMRILPSCHHSYLIRQIFIRTVLSA